MHMCLVVLVRDDYHVPPGFFWEVLWENRVSATTHLVLVQLEHELFPYPAQEVKHVFSCYVLLWCCALSAILFSRFYGRDGLKELIQTTNTIDIVFTVHNTTSLSTAGRCYRPKPHLKVFIRSLTAAGTEDPLSHSLEHWSIIHIITSHSSTWRCLVLCEQTMVDNIMLPVNSSSMTDLRVC